MGCAKKSQRTSRTCSGFEIHPALTSISCATSVNVRCSLAMVKPNRGGWHPTVWGTQHVKNFNFGAGGSEAGERAGGWRGLLNGGGAGGERKTGTYHGLGGGLR